MTAQTDENHGRLTNARSRSVALRIYRVQGLDAYLIYRDGQMWGRMDKQGGLWNVSALNIEEAAYFNEDGFTSSVAAKAYVRGYFNGIEDSQ